MSDLATFFRACLAKDEARAGDVHRVGSCASVATHGEWEGSCDCGVPELIRADVAAKRSILVRFEAAKSQRENAAAKGWPHDITRAAEVAYADDLMDLAQSYADRPGFDPAWSLHRSLGVSLGLSGAALSQRMSEVGETLGMTEEELG